MRRPVVYVVDLLAAVPSVVFGLWGVLVLAPNLQHSYDDVANRVHPIPVLGGLLSANGGGSGSGRAFFTCGLILALMITPIITAITREVFETMPAGQKEAALALGCTRWEMIRCAVFPARRHGITGGGACSGSAGRWARRSPPPSSSARACRSPPHLFSPGDSMAAVIANQFGEATGDFRAALIGLGAVLFFLTIVVNLIARAIVGTPAEATGSGRPMTALSRAHGIAPLQRPIVSAAAGGHRRSPRRWCGPRSPWPSSRCCS